MTTFTKANALFSIIGLFEEAQLARFPGNCWKMRLDCPEKLGEVGSLVISEGLWCILLIHQRSIAGRGWGGEKFADVFRCHQLQLSQE